MKYSVYYAMSVIFCTGLQSAAETFQFDGSNVLFAYDCYNFGKAELIAMADLVYQLPARHDR